MMLSNPSPGFTGIWKGRAPFPNRILATSQILSNATRSLPIWFT